MRLLVGLGNPGEQYSKTRHNAGFWLVDALAGQFPGTSWKSAQGGLLAEVQVNGKKALLFKPQQFMNNSGQPVSQLMRYYEISAEDLAIAADEVYVAPGSARIRKGGGDGGHNGWKSLLEQVSEDTFWRIRIGVGVYEQSPEKRMHQPALDQYVLQNLVTHERHQVNKMIDKLVPNLIKWLEHGSLAEETLHL